MGHVRQCDLRVPLQSESIVCVCVCVCSGTLWQHVEVCVRSRLSLAVSRMALKDLNLSPSLLFPRHCCSNITNIYSFFSFRLFQSSFFFHSVTGFWKIFHLFFFVKVLLEVFARVFWIRIELPLIFRFAHNFCYGICYVKY